MNWKAVALLAILGAGLLGVGVGVGAGLVERRIRALDRRVASLEKDLAASAGVFSVSSEEFADMRKAGAEHDHKVDVARKISDDAIRACWNDGNVAVDGLNDFIGDRVVCIRPSSVVFVAEPHWPED